jgi:hypothetical protein
MKTSNGARDYEEITLPIDGLSLPLRRYRGSRDAAHSVLLLHGGNTSSRLFREPSGGLVEYLTRQQVDVWTLDWRTSADIIDPLVRDGRPLGGSAEAERRLYALDRVAEADIPLALEAMEQQVRGSISVLGFCLAGGALSMAIARGRLERRRVRNVILCTMGLFYEVTWDGWIKAEDFLLERILASEPGRRAIDAALPGEWPHELARAYDRWPPAWRGGGGRRPIDALFQRLAFMYGEPYARPRLDPRFEQGLHEGYFGSLHMGLYLHAAQMVRRGFAAPLDEIDVIDRSRLDRHKADGRWAEPRWAEPRWADRAAPAARAAGPPARAPQYRSDDDGPPRIVGDLRPEHFREQQVTLITGADNRLWHRDSIDLMYEWLRNEATPVGERTRHEKHVLPRYGHLDLFWSPAAAHDVYPKVLAAIHKARPPVRRAPRAEGAPVSPDHARFVPQS